MVEAGGGGGGSSHKCSAPSTKTFILVSSERVHAVVGYSRAGYFVVSLLRDSGPLSGRSTLVKRYCVSSVYTGGTARWAAYTCDVFHGAARCWDSCWALLLMDVRWFSTRAR